MQNSPIPVTIITGFLGSGKTTLLNSLLQQNEDSNILIIENEAGEINIDRALLQGKNRNNVFELTNGCICCSLNRELGTILNSIILSKVNYDYILIEATGIADPAQIVEMFVSGPRVQKYFKLDGVIGLVDASLFTQQFDKFREIRKQLSQSDVLLINKTDLVDDEKLEQITAKLKEVNPLAKIGYSQFGETENMKILHAEAYHPKKLEKSIIDLSSLTLVETNQVSNHSIQTAGICISGEFEMNRLSLWLENYIQSHTGNILRIKGILSIEGMKYKIILQSVGSTFQVLQGALWEKHEERLNRLVFIGADINNDEIEEQLKSLLVVEK
jgi:G3E family GTPase